MSQCTVPIPNIPIACPKRPRRAAGARLWESPSAESAPPQLQRLAAGDHSTYANATRERSQPTGDSGLVGLELGGKRDTGVNSSSIANNIVVKLLFWRFRQIGQEPRSHVINPGHHIFP